MRCGVRGQCFLVGVGAVECIQYVFGVHVCIVDGVEHWLFW